MNKERCNHKGTEHNYRVTCEDCGVIIIPDMLDRFDGLMRNVEYMFNRMTKIDNNIENISSNIKDIYKEIKKRK